MTRVEGETEGFKIDAVISDLHYGGPNVLEAQPREVICHPESFCTQTEASQDISFSVVPCCSVHSIYSNCDIPSISLPLLRQKTLLSSTMSLESINIPHLPSSLPIYAALYRGVQNAAFLRQQLISANTDFEYAFIDASMVCWARVYRGTAILMQTRYSRGHMP